MNRIAKKLPSQLEILCLFDYDPIQGRLIWRERPWCLFANERAAKIWNTRFCGKDAGHKQEVKEGSFYIYVGLRGKDFLAHRLIWKMQVGGLSQFDEIDHKDGNGCNNSWSNLRIASFAQNQQNKAGYKSDGLPKCVWKKGNCFYSKIHHGGKSQHLGMFGSPEEAHAAYLERAYELHGEFMHP